MKIEMKYSMKISGNANEIKSLADNGGLAGLVGNMSGNMPGTGNYQGMDMIPDYVEGLNGLGVGSGDMPTGGYNNPSPFGFEGPIYNAPQADYKKSMISDKRSSCASGCSSCGRGCSSPGSSSVGYAKPMMIEMNSSQGYASKALPSGTSYGSQGNGGSGYEKPMIMGYK